MNYLYLPNILINLVQNTKQIQFIIQIFEQLTPHPPLIKNLHHRFKYTKRVGEVILVIIIGVYT